MKVQWKTVCAVALLSGFGLGCDSDSDSKDGKGSSKIDRVGAGFTNQAADINEAETGIARLASIDSQIQAAVGPAAFRALALVEGSDCAQTLTGDLQSEADDALNGPEGIRSLASQIRDIVEDDFSLQGSQEISVRDSKEVIAIEIAQPQERLVMAVGAAENSGYLRFLDNEGELRFFVSNEQGAERFDLGMAASDLEFFYQVQAVSPYLTLEMTDSAPDGVGFISMAMRDAGSGQLNLVISDAENSVSLKMAGATCEYVPNSCTGHAEFCADIEADPAGQLGGIIDVNIAKNTAAAK